MENIVDHEGDELFRKMVGTIVVRAVGQDDRHVIGMVPGHYEMVGGSLGSGVWRAGVVRGFFGEETFGAQGTIYFIGRHVVEQFAFEIISPERAADMKQVGGAHYVGADKGQGVHDGAVYMAFSGQVDDGIALILFEQGFDPRFVNDVAFLEGIVGSLFDVLAVSQVTGIV